MKLTKFEHSCVRIERDGAVLVIDPGPWTSAAALDGVDAVLVTHEHFDHLDVDRLADTLEKRPAVTVHAHPAVIGKLAALAGVTHTVASGDAFNAAGYAVRAFGGLHARVHPDSAPPVPNLGFLVEGTVYHPGDSFDVPDVDTIETLYVPISGPWLRLSESIDFVRAVAPRRAYALHDGLHNEIGNQVADYHMGLLSGCDYGHLTPGTTVSV